MAQTYGWPLACFHSRVERVRMSDQALPDVEPPRTPAGTMRRRVLVVDDNASVRDVLRDSLTLFGYDVVTAAEGQEALVVFDAAPCDVVLTDLAMPGMDGWQVAETIRARSTVPVILITGCAREVDLMRARDLGRVLLQKPVRLIDLRRAVEQALGGGG